MAQFSSELLSSPQRRWLLREGDEEHRRDFQPELVRYDEIVNILVGGSIV